MASATKAEATTVQQTSDLSDQSTTVRVLSEVEPSVLMAAAPTTTARRSRASCRKKAKSHAALRVKDRSMAPQLTQTNVEFEIEDDPAIAFDVFQRKLPGNIYTAVIVTWLNLSKGSCFEFLVVQLPIVFALMISLGAQYILTYYLKQSVHNGDGDLGDDCMGTTPLLRYTATVCFISLSIQDLQETWDMHLWIDIFPRAAAHEKLRLRQFVAGADDGAGPKHSFYKPATGIVSAARFLFYVTVSCKFGMALYVMLTGAGAVLRSGNDFDMVLNTVAAVFVLDLHDVAYTLLVPERCKVIDRLPALTVDPKDGRRALLRVYGLGFVCRCFCRGGSKPVGQLEGRVEAVMTRLQTALYLYVVFGLVCLVSWALVELYWCAPHALHARRALHARDLSPPRSPCCLAGARTTTSPASLGPARPNTYLTGSRLGTRGRRRRRERASLTRRPIPAADDGTTRPLESRLQVQTRVMRIAMSIDFRKTRDC